MRMREQTEHKAMLQVSGRFAESPVSLDHSGVALFGFAPWFGLEKASVKRILFCLPSESGLRGIDASGEPGRATDLARRPVVQRFFGQT